MTKRGTTSAIAITIALGGCGGGGGGIASTPAPPVATPTPASTNTVISDLRASQSFVNDATRTDVAFNTTSKATIAGRAGTAPLTISYDASSN
jgi:hypothetical protein